MQIHPINYKRKFLDNNDTAILAKVELGKFIYGKEGNKQLDGNLLMKTMQVEVSDGSLLKMYVEDKQRESYREVPTKYLVGRKPMIYGNSKRVTVGFKNEGSTGFRLNDLVWEAERVNRRQ